MDRSADIAIVGAGIAGLAHAYLALKQGYKVVLFEREQFAIGASVRNFGLVWPIGQEPGEGLELALKSRQHWLEVSQRAGFWLHQNGSMHVVYHDDELAVLEEFIEKYSHSSYQCKILTPHEAIEKSPVIKREGLRGALWSNTEATVYSREAVRAIPEWLVLEYGLQIKYGHVVTGISMPKLETSRGTWTVDHVIICSGADFETLYPQVFDQHPMTKCKLQMMKAVPQRPVQIGPTLCAGLTLRHYTAFSSCPSLKYVDARYDQINHEFKTNGIHVLLAQNQQGELIIGDSHHYARTLEPFDSEMINQHIREYLATFTDLGPLQITERWHGIYPKHTGSIKLMLQPEPGVTIVNGLGGAGMTLSFGIAESVIQNL